MLNISAILVKFGEASPALFANIEILISLNINVILVDNSSIRDNCQRFGKVNYQYNGNRNGIAGGLNLGIKAALELGADYVLLLDQDMTFDPQLLNSYLLAATKVLENKKIACCGPSFIDVKYDKQHGFAKYGFLKINARVTEDSLVSCLYLITSGTIIPADVIRTVGLMDESLFIDYVDIEWCLRARNMGFSAIGLQDFKFLHNVGDEVIGILGFKVVVHSKIRLYYQSRNLLILCKRSYIPSYWKICEFLYGVKRSVFYCVTNLSALPIIFKGFIDGIKN